MQIKHELNPEQSGFMDQLRSLNRSELKQLYRELEPPSFDQIKGEFESELLCQGGSFSEALTRKLLNSYGEWVGKAFEPTTDQMGYGYTCFNKGGVVHAALPSVIRIGDSLTGNGQAMLIEYPASRGMARLMADEVRQLCPGLLLGIGTYGVKFGQRDRWRRKMPFALLGPVRPLQMTQGMSAAA